MGVGILVKYTQRIGGCQSKIVRCSNDTIQFMCYNYGEYLERAMACSGRKILGLEEMRDYENWTPY